MIRFCQRRGCRHRVKPGREKYCSRSCTMRAVKAAQTPERRRTLAIQARRAQWADGWARCVARCLLEPTREAQLWAAYQYGRNARKTADYRARQVAK